MYRILVLSDTHCGNLTGLTPPEFWNGETRQWLEPFWTFFENTIGQIGRVDLAVWNGDLVDGPQYKDPSVLLVADLNKQIAMARRIVDSVSARKRVIVRGTGYHSDRQCSYEEIVAEGFGISAVDDYRCEVNGVRAHFRHVVGRSDVPYGQYTQVAKELTNEILQAELEEYDHASLLGRAHVHYCVRIGQLGPDGKWREAWTNPALQLRRPGGAFARGLRTWMYHVGVVLVEIDRTGWATVRPIGFPITLYAPREYECLTEP